VKALSLKKELVKDTQNHGLGFKVTATILKTKRNLYWICENIVKSCTMQMQSHQHRYFLATMNKYIGHIPENAKNNC
jgi:hypothetical protein